MECDNPLLIEKQIKIIFHEKFKLFLGNEFFQGDEIQMCEEFFKIINKDLKYNSYLGFLILFKIVVLFF